MNQNELNRLTSELVKIGDKIAEWRVDKNNLSILDAANVKTEADLKAQNLILKLLKDEFGNPLVLSEEDTKRIPSRPEKYWLIDPIDGTASWLNGYDGFVTQIAYIENSVPIFGAVYAPVMKKLWTGLRHQGARLNDKKLPRLEKSNRVVLVDNYPKPKRIAQKITEAGLSTDYLECGSLGLKSCLVADGTADLFVKDVVIRDWDIAPAEVILHEVGALICDLKGQSIVFDNTHEKNSGLIVARDAQLLNDVIKII